MVGSQFGGHQGLTCDADCIQHVQTEVPCRVDPLIGGQDPFAQVGGRDHGHDQADPQGQGAQEEGEAVAHAAGYPAHPGPQAGPLSPGPDQGRDGKEETHVPLGDQGGQTGPEDAHVQPENEEHLQDCVQYRP